MHNGKKFLNDEEVKQEVFKWPKKMAGEIDENNVLLFFLNYIFFKNIEKLSTLKF